MFWRRSVVTLVVLLTAMASLMGQDLGLATSARAARNTTFPPPKEGPKVTLADTSIDGPALATTNRPATVLAWTATDSSHYLNVAAVMLTSH